MEKIKFIIPHKGNESKSIFLVLRVYLDFGIIHNIREMETILDSFRGGKDLIYEIRIEELQSILITVDSQELMFILQTTESDATKRSRNLQVEDLERIPGFYHDDVITMYNLRISERFMEIHNPQKESELETLKKIPEFTESYKRYCKWFYVEKVEKKENSITVQLRRNPMKNTTNL